MQTIMMMAWIVMMVVGMAYLKMCTGAGSFHGINF